MQEKTTKTIKIAKAADSLSLGISIVVAILIGVGLGLWLKGFFGLWGLWGGVLLGIFAAINNIYKAYKEQKQSYAELGNSNSAITPKEFFKDDEIDEILKG